MVTEHAYRLGIDIGGTFTDLVLIGADGSIVTHKVLSTPDDYGRAIVAAISDLTAQGRLQPEPESMLSADNIANMRQDGISVVGPAPASVLPEVTAEQIREAVRQMLREIPECPTELKAASEILDLVRSYRALETGAPATKSEGLRWGLVRLNAVLHPVLQRADAVRRGASVASDDRTLRDGIEEVRAALRDSSSEASSEQ